MGGGRWGQGEFGVIMGGGHVCSGTGSGAGLVRSETLSNAASCPESP